MINNGLKVGDFMARLQRMDQDEEVKFDFVHFGPTTLESYRGYYEDAALGYDECGRMHGSGQYSYPKVRELLEHFQKTLGHVFEGWKGGNGRSITLGTTLWVANPGETGDTIIVDVQKLLYVTIITRHNEQEEI